MVSNARFIRRAVMKLYLLQRDEVFHKSLVAIYIEKSCVSRISGSMLKA